MISVILLSLFVVLIFPFLSLCCRSEVSCYLLGVHGQHGVILRSVLAYAGPISRVPLYLHRATQHWAGADRDTRIGLRTFVSGIPDNRDHNPKGA